MPVSSYAGYVLDHRDEILIYGRSRDNETRPQRIPKRTALFYLLPDQLPFVLAPGYLIDTADIDTKRVFLYYFSMNNDKLITPEMEFQEIDRLIKRAKSEALKHVNKELINLYWNVGRFIDSKLKSSQWGDNVVEQLAVYLKKSQPGLKGFSRWGLYRMRQFYVTYAEVENVSTLLTQIPWSGHRSLTEKTWNENGYLRNQMKLRDKKKVI